MYCLVGMEVRLIVCLFAVWSVHGIAQPTQIPPCRNVAEMCDPSCREVIISTSYVAGYSSANVLCMDVNSSDTFRVRGCPILYFDSDASGVCTNATDGNGTELLLEASELGPGRHVFKCLVSNTKIVATADVLPVVANDDNPYRDIQVFINGVLQDEWNGTHVALDAGDNLTIAIQTVGSVDHLSVNNASEERFTCGTGFACNQNTRNDVKNRYLQCSLRSPADARDDDRVLRVSLDNMNLTTIIANISIILNEGPPLPPTSTPTSTGVSSPTTTGTTASPTPAVNQSVTDNTVEPIITSSSTTTAATNTATTTNTATIGTATTSSPVAPTVSTGHSITPATTSPSDTSTDEHFSFVGIGVIIGITLLLITIFIIFGVLMVYRLYKKAKGGPQVATKHPHRMAVSNAYKVLSYSCPHCDKLDEQIKDQGYDVQKLPKQQATDTEETHQFPPDESVPVIVCGHPECKISSDVLESSPVPENWKILQLQQQTPTGENPTQSNKRVTVLNCNNLDEGIPVGKVLNWLNNISRRGTIISTNGEQLNEMGRDIQKLVEKTDEILEKQDQANTSLSALQIDSRQE